jgi:hypothetical protein
LPAAVELLGSDLEELDELGGAPERIRDRAPLDDRVRGSELVADRPYQDQTRISRAKFGVISKKGASRVQLCETLELCVVMCGRGPDHDVAWYYRFVLSGSSV